MKKIWCFVLVFAMLISFAACEDNGGNPSSTGSGTTASENSTTEPTTDFGTEEIPTPPESPNEKTDFVACLRTLLSGYKWNPNYLIPEKMRPEYVANLTNVNQLNHTYSNFVSTSAIPQNGVGEQWNMVMENISQSQMFFNVLSVIDGIATTSVTAFNNYIDQNPADTAHYQFAEGIYSVVIHGMEDTIDYVLDYTATLPVLGEQSVQIALSMDIEKETKTVRIQIGDANALTYTIAQDRYTFAIRYLGVRRAYFEWSQNADDTITGHIYEYLTVAGIEAVSMADFYIMDDYVTVVGNKASGLIGFRGSICELYSVETGRMIAYEVQETQTILGVEVTFNTLWFDLADINGITSIKYVPAASAQEADAIYINGQSDAWENKLYGISGGKKVASRRYDIEFRTQYFYYYDAANGTYEKIEQQVPMLFVQEEVYENLTADVREKNNVTVAVTISAGDLAALKAEYSEKVAVLFENKDTYTVAWILEYIGEKKTFAS